MEYYKNMFGVNNDYYDEMLNYPCLSKMTGHWLIKHNFDKAWDMLINDGLCVLMEKLEYLANQELLKEGD